MVATVAEKGYEATTVADLVELSGVSRSAFYRHYDDKQACFLAAVEAMVEPTLQRLGADESAPAGVERARRAFASLFELIVSQPAAAKMCVVEVYAAGPEGAALVDRTIESATTQAAHLLQQVPERKEMPVELVRALVGGIQKVIHKRLYRGQEQELLELVPQLWEWLFSYPVPPGPLKATRRRTVKPVPFAERQAQSSPPERLLRALAAVVAEKGYPDTTVAEIVDRASTSQRTFYEHFKNKEDAIVAALDSGSAHMLAAALPAFRRASDWPHAVHDTQEAMFAFGAEEPEYARLGGVEMYAAGKRALDQREVVTEGMEGLLAPATSCGPRPRRSPPRRSAGPSTHCSMTTSTKRARRRCRTWCRRWSTSPWRRSSKPKRHTRWRSGSPTRVTFACADSAHANRRHRRFRVPQRVRRTATPRFV